MTRPEKECLKFGITISMVVFGILLMLFTGPMFFVGLLMCIIGLFWGNTVNDQMIDLARKWKRLGLGSVRTFPDTDYLRVGYLSWAHDKLKELASKYTSAERVYGNAKAQVDYWRMNKPITIVNPVGFELALREEEEELAHKDELKRCCGDAEKALQRIKQQYQMTWRLFEQMTIGNGKEIPKNMLPVHSGGSHWAHLEAYRKHVAKGCPSPESPQEARVDQEGGDDIPS